MKPHRIAYLDLVKLFTIYLVILGHVIGMMVNGYAVGEKLYSFIYSFHMPLFMLLSGYFVSHKALSRPFSKFLLKKGKQLLLPAITCTILCCIYLYLFRGQTNFRDEVIGNSWFLKTLFVFYVLFYWLKKTGINDWILFFVSCGILFVIPKGSTLQINLLFPYFWGGYFLKKYGLLSKLSFSWKNALLFLMLFVGAYFLQRRWGMPNYVAINIDSLQSQWHLILFRYVVAFLGSLSTIIIISMFFHVFRETAIVSKISEFGQWTLGVYVLQTIFVINIFPDTFAWYVDCELMLDFIVAPMLALFFLVLCLFIIWITSNRKWLDLFLFGGLYYHH